MLLPLDAMAARQRYEDMLKESEQIRLANRVAKASGKVSLLSRMVKLLSRSSNQPETLASGTLNQPTMVEAKVR
jgi:hypothetical protein